MHQFGKNFSHSLALPCSEFELSRTAPAGLTAFGPLRHCNSSNSELAFSVTTWPNATGHIDGHRSPTASAVLLTLLERVDLQCSAGGLALPLEA
jgi:hypothetical protein